MVGALVGDVVGDSVGGLVGDRVGGLVVGDAVGGVVGRRVGVRVGGNVVGVPVVGGGDGIRVGGAVGVDGRPLFRMGIGSGTGGVGEEVGRISIGRVGGSPSLLVVGGRVVVIVVVGGGGDGRGGPLDMVGSPPTVGYIVGGMVGDGTGVAVAAVKVSSVPVQISA